MVIYLSGSSVCSGLKSGTRLQPCHFLIHRVLALNVKYVILEKKNNLKETFPTLEMSTINIFVPSFAWGCKKIIYAYYDILINRNNYLDNRKNSIY